MTLALRYLAHSEIGLVRKNNQDSAYTSPTMLVVADGMGGAAAGDLASAVAVKELRAADGPSRGDEMLTTLAGAIDAANRQINELIDADPSLDGMGSTVCGVMFDGETLGLANIGDSRAYRWRDGQLTRLSRDHSWVQSLVDEGRITEAEALVHPHRSLILRVINGQPQHQPDLELVDARAGDRLLICSDGLCGLVTDADIAERMDGDPEQVMSSLIEVAHAAGGLDNITIILADVVEGEPSGDTGVYGAAAGIDLDAPSDTLTLDLTADATPRPSPQAGEQARYAPTARRSLRARLTLALVVLLPILALAGGGAAWYSYLQQQYYVGPHDQTVAIFRGVPDQLFAMPLSQLVEDSDVLLTDLPVTYRDDVTERHPAASLDDARRYVSRLRIVAEECRQIRQAREQETATPVPSQSGSGLPSRATPGKTPTKPTADASATPTANASASPSGTPSPTATPTDTLGC